MSKAQITASALGDLLASRHAGDVFVPQCKMGEVGSRVLDAWALLPTWRPLTAIAYEIKVSRSDWLRDAKLDAYRACCHLLVVVAPKGVVLPAELPTGAGLLEPIGQGTGQRLLMRVKPVRHAPDDAALVRLMAYVLMWRRDERADRAYGSREQRAARWRAWVDERKDFRVISSDVKGRMRAMLTDALADKARAESHAARLSEAAEILRELGVPPVGDPWWQRRKIEDALCAESDVALGSIDQALTALTALRRRIAQSAEREEATA